MIDFISDDIIIIESWFPSHITIDLSSFTQKMAPKSADETAMVLVARFLRSNNYSEVASVLPMADVKSG